MEKLYEGFKPDEIDYINEKRRQIITAAVSPKNTTVHPLMYDWLSIFVPHLQKLDKRLKIMSDKVYFTEEHLTHSFPVDPQASRAYPFNEVPHDDHFKLKFIETTTGVKVYDYAKLLTPTSIPEHLRWTNLSHIDILLVQNQKHKVKTYRSENTVLILTNDLNNKLIKEALTVIPSIFSINEIQEDTNIAECLKSIIKGESIRPYFEELLNARNKEQDEKLNNLLKSSLTASSRRRFNELASYIESKRSHITSLEHDLEQIHEQLQSLLDEKLTVETKLKENPEQLEELMSFIKNNKFIKSVFLKAANIDWHSGEYPVFELEAPITLYEPEPLQRQICNLSERYNPTGQDCLDVLAEIFLKDKYTLYCTTFVGVNLSTGAFDSSTDNLNISRRDYKKMYQPHLSQFNCWGDQKSNIKLALKQSNLIDALQLMTISIQNINFTDTTVLNRWIEKISNSSYYYTDCKCIKDKDNNWYTFKEIADIVKARQKIKVAGEPGIAQPELVDELEGEE